MATIEEAMRLAVGHHNAGRLAEAEAIYRQVLAVAPEQPDALHLLGVAARAGRRPAEAERLIRQALGRRPDWPEAEYNLGNALADLGRQAEAEAMLRKAAAARPGWADPWFAVGNLYRAHQPGIASLAFRNVVAAQPAQPAAYAALAQTALADGRHDEAVRLYRRLLRLQPGDAVALRNLGLALQAAGRLEEALPPLRRAADQGAPAIAVPLGATLRWLGRTDEAEALMRRELEQPDRLSVDGTELEMLGDILACSGRVAEMRALCRPLRGHSTQAGMARTLIAESLLAEGDAAAAAAEVDFAWNHGRFFAVKSAAAFRLDLEARGLPLPRRRASDPSRPAVSVASLATRGRFAQNMLEYMLVRLYAEPRGIQVETPDWAGHWFFELDDPAIATRRPPVSFLRRRLNRLIAGADEPALVGIDIDAPYAPYQFEPAWRERIRGWLRPRPEWLPRLDPVVARLRERGDTVLAIHIRRGDFLQFGYPITETQVYVDWLERHWDEFPRPVLFLASDDLARVRADFARFAPVCLPELGTPWRGLDFAQDFHVLCHADVVGTSARSGFSFVAALLNARATRFLVPRPGRGIAAFDPWREALP